MKPKLTETQDTVLNGIVRHVLTARGDHHQSRVRPEGFWWDCGFIFDELSAGVFGEAEYPLADASPVHAG